MTPPQPSTDIATKVAALGTYRHSLIWRLILPLPLTLIAAIALTWVAIPRMIQQNILNETILDAQQIAERFQTLRSYYTDRVVAKVVSRSLMQATSDHMTNPDAIPLPATMILDLSDLFARSSTTIRLYSRYPFPARANRQLDQFQQDALDFLAANPKATFSRTETQGDKHIVRTAVADVMTVQACVSCHNTIASSPKTDWKIGDVRGVLEVDFDGQIANGLRLSNYFIVGIVAGGLILLGVLLLAARSVIGPIREIAKQTTKLAAGNFDVVLPGLTRKDEIGEMAHAIEVFRKNGLEIERLRVERAERESKAAADRKVELHRLADEFQYTVGTIVNAVSSTANQLEHAAKGLAETAKTTELRSQSVATACEEASTNVQSVAAATTEMAKSIYEIVRQVSESNKIATRAVQQAGTTDTRITDLSKIADHIGDVVKLITGIAQQTNLLALNATIEAARAGEAGRGFTIVAQEVKALASQTANATNTISNDIAAMQSATADSFAAIKQIGATINRISEIATTVASAIEEQDAVTSEIAHKIQQVADVTTQVSADISEVNRDTSETGLASAQVLSSAELLSNESSRLKQELDGFLAKVRAA